MGVGVGVVPTPSSLLGVSSSSWLPCWYCTGAGGPRTRTIWTPRKTATTTRQDPRDRPPLPPPPLREEEP